MYMFADILAMLCSWVQQLLSWFESSTSLIASEVKVF